jgi:hypothetical protein
MAESEVAKGEMMPIEIFQTRIVGESEWVDRPARSIMGAALAASISASINKRICDVVPIVAQVRKLEGLMMPYDVTTLDVVCLVQFMVTTRDPSERN